MPLIAMGLVGASPARAVASPAQSALPRPSLTRPFHVPVPEVDRNHVFVKFRSLPSNASARIHQAGAGIERLMTRTGWTVVSTNGDAQGVAARLRRDPSVAKVSLSYIRHATSVPNDPRWASAQRDYLGPLRMDRAWDVSKGSGVTVGVLDTGADFSHPDLTGQFVNNTGINELALGSQAQDDNGHGTMTAGIIAAKMNNARGIAGIAPQAKLLPVKVLDSSGSGTDNDIAQGIIDATDAGVKVISMSLGGPGGGDVLCPAVDYALSHDVVVVASAGNDFAETIGYPASCTGVIAVSATTHDGALAAFSSYGWRTDIAAPGFNITSTSLGSPATADAYATESGTSFSAPIVSGVAALVRSHYGYTGTQTHDRILATARDVGPPGVDAAFGHGMVDPLAAVGGPPLAPHPSVATGAEEPDGTPSSAKPLSIGVTTSAQIFPETDEDWYSVALTQNQWYRVRVAQVGASAFDHDMNPLIRLYDASAHFLASQEFAGGDLVFKAPATATFLLRIANVEGATKPYTILMSTVSQPPVLQSPVDINLLSTAQSVAIGDLNGDGRPDVAFLMGDSSAFFDTLVVLDQTPRRSFVLGDVATLPFAVSGNGLVIGDANNDGHNDVLFPTSSGVEVVPGTASGIDTNSLHWSTLHFAGARQAAVADIDKDGSNDVVAAGTGGVKVFWSGADDNTAGLGGWGSSTSLAVGDISSDTHPDVVAISNGTVRAAVWATGHSLPSPVSMSLSGASNVAIGGQKIAVTIRNSSATGAVRVLSYSGSALHQDRSINLAETNPQPVAVADIDGGGNDVIVLHDSSGDIGSVPVAGGSEAAFAGDRQPSSQYDARALAVGDIDGDGQPDAVVATSFGITIVMHRLDTLPATYGSHVVSASDPEPLTDGFDGTSAMTLTLSHTSTNAGSAVTLLDGAGNPVATSPVSDGGTVTVTPSSALSTGAYSVRLNGLQDNGVPADSVDDALPFVVGHLDETAPNLSLMSPPSGFVTTPPHTIAFTSTDSPQPTLECRIDNGTYHSCTSPVSVNTTLGAHTLDVLARDDAGNETIKSASWNYRPPPHGYWMVGAGGAVYHFGSTPSLGSAKTYGAADFEASPSGYGYWIVDVTGHVFAFGDAKYYGGAGTLSNELVTSISRTADGKGYWLFTSRGRVIARGDAHNYGDMHTKQLHGAVIDSVATPSGHGYYMVGSDGGVFTFGDAKFYGSTGAKHLAAPVRTLTPDPDGVGYWLVGTNGAVYSFQAAYHGSMAGTRLAKPVVGMVSFGNGYLMVAADGGIFNFSNKTFYGSLGAHPPTIPIVSAAAYG